MALPAAATGIQLHRPSSLLAIACADFVLRIVDLDARRIVREFRGHRNRITDLAFSPDARTVVTAGMDGTLRAWDVPTGFMVDCFSTPAICTSLAYSPKGDFLATAHADSVGIYLWNDRRLFTAVSVRQVTEEEGAVQELPVAAEIEGDSMVDDLDKDGKDAEEEETPATAFGGEDDGMVTLSNLPRSKWHSLLHLESIKVRSVFLFVLALKLTHKLFFSETK
jgi:U3 small nucleolar RNA-associated protein 21